MADKTSGLKNYLLKNLVQDFKSKINILPMTPKEYELFLFCVCTFF